MVPPIALLKTGAGEEALPCIFHLFVQENEGGRDSLGIGLNLVRGLVSLHGGTVEASSPGRGQGSEFTVRLPL